MTAATTAPPSASEICDVHIPETPVPHRVHDDGHLLFWQARGSSGIVLDGVLYPVTAGQALWVPPGVRHHGIVHAGSVLIPMLFPVDEFATTLTEPRTVTVDLALETLLLARIQLESTLIRPKSEVARQILTVVEGRPGSDDRSTTPTTPTSSPARRVAEMLRLDPGDPRSLSELAAAAHVSVRTLQRMFVDETGTDFRHWRLQNRMASAGELLGTGAGVGAVARRLGYRDASSFSRAFRRTTGVSPSDWGR